MTKESRKILKGLIKINGVQRSTEQPVGDFPESLVEELRSEPLQAIVLKIGDNRVVAYITNIDSREMVAVDVLR